VIRFGNAAAVLVAAAAGDMVVHLVVDDSMRLVEDSMRLVADSMRLAADSERLAADDSERLVADDIAPHCHHSVSAVLAGMLLHKDLYCMQLVHTRRVHWHRILLGRRILRGHRHRFDHRDRYHKDLVYIDPDAARDRTHRSHMHFHSPGGQLSSIHEQQNPYYNPHDRRIRCFRHRVSWWRRRHIRVGEDMH